MTDATSAARWRAGILAAVLIAGGGGYWLGQRGESEAPAEATAVGRKILYYYDPMFPNQKFDKPGKSPFMDMQLEPKYADEGSGAAPGVSVDPAARQSLGIRVVAAEMGSLAATFDVNGSIDFNQRDVAIVQARSGGFVERVYRLAPGDVIGAGTPIADLQLPEWGSAQTEYLSVKRLGKPELTAAARQRLRLMGMPEGVISEVDRSGRTGGRLTVRAPIGGVVQTLGARAGVTLAAGQTLAEISGLGTVWLNAALPEAQAGLVQVGQRATATLTAFPGEAFTGRIIAILPTASADSRTLTVRVELANRGGRLRPGMFAVVALGGDAKPALLVPSEAVIRTGTRSIVMLEKGDGRYHPAEVITGREGGGKTEILQGLAPGEKVVASGQFLLDSEASLTGLTVRPLEPAQ
ncbi:MULTISPECIES: efflux RND transporter periplasmic adaptor subunit [unclassified Sphingopyxis]|uniref:efflux RND transporter periplasmic adaptor subunit n=3 Tax=Sphingopyxis TaxID=165697 RepID=UPI0007363829|nr:MULTISPECIES: efflux RND transporter periplasmic adaptor subunit [unclassified Sphingopyxis]KTE26982.1 RND transporter [Sphingopyxis sp. H057]KTE54288.1 RND transporter [Sphingopyxis sp. H073]KTE56609.1 RND transporter [Sphingopyxis sp. H071]KTE58360.1 RND transporter [Sphingopyxis sp. H107]KTE68269.1 RND transporter [Sphingopyxis sp. H100]